MIATIDALTDGKNGSLIHRVWPGGYPVIYFCENGDVLCPKCADALFAHSKKLRPDDFLVDSEILIGGDVYYEGATIQCEECNKGIDSAYGDPEGGSDCDEI